MHRTRRPSLRRALASGLAAVLVAAGALVGVAAPAQAASDPALTATVGVTPGVGIDIAVAGTGFQNVQALPGQTAPHVYLALVTRDGYDVDQASTPNTDAVVDAGGNVAGTLTQTAAKLDRATAYDVIAWPSRSFPSASNLLARTAVTIDWEALFPPTATTTTLTVSPSGSAVSGTSVALTATVTPAASGAVEFFDGSVSLGSVAVAVAAGSAQVSTSALSVGGHSLTAVFTPADAATSGSTSDAVAYDIAAVVEPEKPAPAVSVFLADGVTAYTGQALYDGDTVVVKGRGFVPDAPATDGTRPPLAGAFGGAYVGFGFSAGDAWTSAGRSTEYTRWAVSEGDVAKIGGAAAGAVAIAADGTFATTLSVVRSATAPDGARFGVRTWAAGGAVYAPFSTFTVVDAAGSAPEPAPTPTVTVSKTADLDPTGETVTVTGTGFLPHSPDTDGTRPPLQGSFTGAYVVFGSFAADWRPSTGATSSARKGFDTKWGLLAADVSKVGGAAAGAIEIAADGSFSTTLHVSKADGALANGTWGVYTYAAGGATYAPFETATPISFAAEVPPVDGPTVTVTPASGLDPAVENVLTVSGTGFTGPGAANGVYVLFGESSLWSGQSALPAGGWIAQAWVPTILDGAFTTTLTIPAGTLEPGTSYQVATSAAHGLSLTDRSLDTFTAVTVAMPTTTTPTVFLSAPSVVQGGSLTVRGSGFPAGVAVTVEVHSDVVTLGTTTVGDGGLFSVTGVIPATLPAGAHTVVVRAGDITVQQPITIEAASASPAPEAVTAPVAVCTARAVDGASLTWGVKQSFVSYVNGPIAKGSASIAWRSGSGAFNTEEGIGRVSFGGAASFTGHGGLLDLTISNPVIQVTGARTATLSAYVQSKGYGGSPSVDGRVVLANLTLPAATTRGGAIAWTDAAATLTAAGAEAFGGFYAAGESLDPVSFTFPLGADVPCDTATSGALAATGGTMPGGTVWVGLGMLLLGAGLVAIRRRTMADRTV
ncbi:HtaA domain-containing protein [Microbacterium sp. NFH-22A-Y]|uniref:HtaA domain-containing protein n=1 Tax=Microbacterium sp. NFH-22A-Y TaxID=2744448 RepID=UPI001F18C801|nr:HtaA domain-containing protein [Microbacterium sp. NFH-22A-Y]